MRSNERVKRGSTPIRVAILAFDGCMTTAVAGLIDSLTIANYWAARTGSLPAGGFVSEVLAASATAVRGSGGFSIPTRQLAHASAADILIVPPIMGPISETLHINREIVGLLREQPQATVIASVCTGAFFLAEAGLLRGGRATTNPAHAEAFRRNYPEVELTPDARLIDRGRVLCAGSTTAFLDLGIYLIDRFASHELAVLTAKSLCIDLSHRSQLPYFVYVAPKDHGDTAILAVQTWLEDHHHQSLSIGELAGRAAMSTRSLNRRFRVATGMAPTDYLHRLRIESAKRLLETSDLTVDQITARVGYEDQRSFSRLFRSLAGLSPRAYRTRFGPQKPAATG